MEAAGAVQTVTLTIDGKEITVPKGTNVIEAAKQIGVEIPHYCYHPHLSVPGNCRMCQVKVEGAPKLLIGCHALCQDGMVVQTHNTSEEVKDAQAATLEFILINHPLDCTVCDQAGHCKLQDYHFEYNARPSRFVEHKVHKAKAKPLGPTVMLDGERCIMCTRCIRFCDEVTGTSELGMLNRGDRSEITVNEGHELSNPLSGSVVDLCPVGALTHREWRFNTRIWFTRETKSICPGCSTGCNVRVAERDGQIVQVKARLNDHVNKEWLCDEGRYGFHRFLPETRLTAPRVKGESCSLEDAIASAATLKGKPVAVFAGTDLLLEEYYSLKAFIDRCAPESKAVISYRERSLTEVEAVLISPDYAPNFRGAEFADLVGEELQQEYERALHSLRAGEFSHVLIVGDRGILPEDCDAALVGAVGAAQSVAILTAADHPLADVCGVVLPGRSILEKSGLLLNGDGRLQYAERVVDAPQGSESEWKLLSAVASKAGAKIYGAAGDREATLEYLKSEPNLAGLTIKEIKAGGIDLHSYRPGGNTVESENT